jgi:3'-5' exoribonuclease
MVRKVYVRDLREKDRVHTVFRVGKKARTQARNGKAFMVVTLVDRTGELDARIFERVDELEPAFAEGDYVLVQGGVISFHHKPQLVIEKLEKLDPEPIDPKEFTPAAPPPAAPSPPEEPEGRGGVPGTVRDLIDRIHDAPLRALLQAMVGDPQVAEGLRVGQGRRGTAWAHRGGLAEYLVSFAKLASRIAEHFPSVDRDLVLAGAIAQELGRARGSPPDRPFESTDQGRLVGAAASAAQLVHEKAARVEGLSPLLEQHLTHLALSRTTQPATLEALVLHAARDLEDRVGTWLEAMSRDGGQGHWTDPARHPDGALWKGPVPTGRARAPVEPRKPPRKKDREKEKEKDRDAPPKLSFKPLSELTPAEPGPPAGAEPPTPPEPEGGSQPPP